MRHLVGEADTWLESLMEGIVVVTVIGGGEYFAAPHGEIGQARRSQGVAYIGIKPVHSVEAFGARQIQFVAKAHIDGQLGSDAEIILDKGSELPVLSGYVVGYLI